MGMGRAEWTQMADTGPSGRLGHAVTFDSKIKRVVLFGGRNLSAQFGDTWSWDGAQSGRRSRTLGQLSE